MVSRYVGVRGAGRAALSRGRCRVTVNTSTQRHCFIPPVILGHTNAEYNPSYDGVDA